MEEILKKLSIAKKNLETLEKMSENFLQETPIIKTKIFLDKNSDDTRLEDQLSAKYNKNYNIIPTIFSEIRQLNNSILIQEESFSAKPALDINKIKLAKNALDQLTEISGQFDFQKIKIVGNTIPASWCPEIRPKISNKDLPIISIDRGGTGANNASSARINLGLGSLSTQNSNNVNITGGSISLNGQFNTGVTLSSNSYSTSKLSIRSEAIDFKTTSQIQIFTVPTGYFFLIDEMEIITSSISDPGDAPIVSFGNTFSANAYYGPSVSNSNSIKFRHVIQSPQNAIVQNTTVTFQINEASTAQIHFGFGIITGYLIRTI